MSEWKNTSCKLPDEANNIAHGKSAKGFLEHLHTLMMGVMNSSRKLWRSSEGQLWWMKLINKPLMWEPSWSCDNNTGQIYCNKVIVCEWWQKRVSKVLCDNISSAKIVFNSGLGFWSPSLTCIHPPIQILFPHICERTCGLLLEIVVMILFFHLKVSVGKWWTKFISLARWRKTKNSLKHPSEAHMKLQLPH